MTNVRISTDQIVELIQSGHDTNERISQALGIAFNRKNNAINEGTRNDGVSSSLRAAKKSGRVRYNKNTRKWEVTPTEQPAASAAQ